MQTSLCIWGRGDWWRRRPKLSKGWNGLGKTQEKDNLNLAALTVETAQQKLICKQRLRCYKGGFVIFLAVCPLRELFNCRPCNGRNMQYYLYLSSDWGIGFLKDLANWISWFWNTFFFIYWIQGFSFTKVPWKWLKSCVKFKVVLSILAT